MKIRLTKARIIKALLDEPVERLRGGSWISYDGSVDTIAQFSKLPASACSECAVGAVMRQVLSPRIDPDQIDDASRASLGDFYIAEGSFDDAHAELDAGRPMAALSIVFEHHYAEAVATRDPGRVTTADKKRVRDKVVAFVRKHFPRTMVVDIDDARPARDIAVVAERRRSPR